MVNVAARTAQSFAWLPSIRQWIRRITVVQPAAPHIRAEDEQVQRVTWLSIVPIATLPRRTQAG